MCNVHLQSFCSITENNTNKNEKQRKSVNQNNINSRNINTLARRFGKDRKGHQRFQCLTCKKTFSEPHAKPLGEMILSEEKALSVLHHLVEGCSIRSTERITGVEKKTI